MPGSSGSKSGLTTRRDRGRQFERAPRVSKQCPKQGENRSGKSTSESSNRMDCLMRRRVPCVWMIGVMESSISYVRDKRFQSRHAKNVQKPADTERNQRHHVRKAPNSYGSRFRLPEIVDPRLNRRLGSVQLGSNFRECKSPIQEPADLGHITD